MSDNKVVDSVKIAEEIVHFCFHCDDGEKPLYSHYGVVRVPKTRVFDPQSLLYHFEQRILESGATRVSLVFRSQFRNVGDDYFLTPLPERHCFYKVVESSSGRGLAFQSLN